MAKIQAVKVMVPSEMDALRLRINESRVARRRLENARIKCVKLGQKLSDAQQEVCKLDREFTTGWSRLVDDIAGGA